MSSVLHTIPAAAPLLEDWLQQFPNRKFIAEGALGEVYDSGDGRAIKCKALDDEKDPHREIRILQILAQVPHVPRLHGEPFVSKDRQIAFAMDLSSDSLEYTYCAERKPFASYERIQEVALMALRALAGAHGARVAHFDIKPANITPDHILDWGQAECLPPSMLHIDGQPKVTPIYGPPEEILRLSLSVSADIWSLGCVLYEIATKTEFAKLDPPSRSESQEDIDLLTAHKMRLQQDVDAEGIEISSVKDRLYDQTPEGKYVLKPSRIRPLAPLRTALALARPLDVSIPQWDRFINLIEQMLKIIPDERITAEQALKHPFFQPAGLLEVVQQGLYTVKAYSASEFLPPDDEDSRATKRPRY